VSCKYLVKSYVRACAASKLDVLFLHLMEVFLQVLSPALAVAVVRLQLLCPWEAWAEGEVVEAAWCRVRSGRRRCLLPLSSSE
jgi:hypothetical protein